MVLVTVPLKIGQYIGQYLASQLIKSGIEYVILAGSSVFSCCLQGLNTRYWAATPPPSSTNPPHSPSPCGCVCTHRQDLDALMRTSFVWCAAIGIPRLHSALQVLHTTPCAEALSVGRCVQRLGLLFGSLVLGAFSSLRRRLVHTYNVVTSAQLYILVYPHSSNSNQVEISAIKKERGQCCASSRSAAVCPHLGIVKDTWGPSTQCCARGGASLGPDLAEWCPRGSRGGGTPGLLSCSHGEPIRRSA